VRYWPQERDEQRWPLAARYSPQEQDVRCWPPDVQEQGQAAQQLGQDAHY